MDNDLKSMTIDELAKLMVGYDQPKYLAKNIFSFIHQKHAESIDALTTLSKAFRGQLKHDGFFISRLQIRKILADKDDTIKYQFLTNDGKCVETVFMPEGDKRTLCISTQVGCAMNCAFCATGKLKLARHLTAGEIADQVLQVAAEQGRISNVVYMGMGEPLENYDYTIKSVRILNDQNGADIGARHITISTCGIVPGILKLAAEDMQVRLAVSLNAADDKKRSRIMPINKKYPLAELADALKTYQQKTNRRITIEYVLIKDINDTSNDAAKLIGWLKPLNANVNLIEYNPHEKCEHQSSPGNRIKTFKAQLEKANLTVTIRYRRGRDIQAACGQLGAD